ncbi:helix-turn-helix domain-containing protein [Cyclobacterium sp. 1_MG-2023]|uniref:helix-turn-helix domain-containing protein n=1 Tax=Cyclobacterium sp. 1_MG-2023 TaxID=3062681 RepID=UPI0026E38D7C|nr:helix-turn-helix domain-containing protein [Cyclobacterium sp. 1_MG-2023]MDO6437134.1 helix-turn-helix domain-containing protein [Cyclobacterium sp. 1_MG-2023]
MKENQINFDSIPKGMVSIFEKLRQEFKQETKEIKSLILKSSTETGGDQLFTIQETSEFLHVQKQTLYSYVSKGIIPYNKKAGRLYFSKNDLIEWIKGGNKRAFSVEEEAQKIISKRKNRGGSHE